MSRNRPMIGRLSEILISGNRTGLLTDFGSTSPSPRSPLDCKIQIQHSPRGLKTYDLPGGVGLGIVAALEKYAGRSVSRSDPIPVGPCKSSERNPRSGTGVETESLEENYTYVTSHGPDKSFTKVYYDAGEYEEVSTGGGIFSLSNKELPPKSLGDVHEPYPASDFLSSCNLCKKKLHGRDIYMYRGEKAFCSVECRSRQIMVDEHREQCRSEVVPRSADVSSSPYTASPIFSTGIVAI